MPLLETPPSTAPPNPPVKVRTRRFGELEEHELIHLLDSLDDERSKARFRESIYISIFFYLAVAWFLFYGPRVLFHQPRLISPTDVLKDREKQLTFLDAPKDLSKSLPPKSNKVISDKDRMQQAVRPTLDKKTLEQLEAMRKAGAPAPPAPAPQAEPTPQPQAKQPPPQPPPLPQHPPQQPTQLADAPKPAPTRPNFGNPNQSAGDVVRQAAEQAARSHG